MKKLIMSFYTLFVVFTLLSILAIYAFSPNFNNALNAHIETGSHTDISVLVVALITFIAAAATLLVSWFIKEEATEIGNRATEIGNRIITSSTMQRYVDRMHYEYSDLIERVYESIESKKDDPDIAKNPNDAFHLLVDLRSWDWLKEKMRLSSDTTDFVEFIENLMPGEFGKKYRERFFVKEIIKLFAESKELEKIFESAKTASHSGDQKQKDAAADQMKVMILTRGKAVFFLMVALGWVPQNEATKKYDWLSDSYDQKKWSLEGASENGLERLKKSDTMNWQVEG